MAGPQDESQRRNWKKIALGLFVVAAAAGLVLGLIAAFKPEAYGNKKTKAPTASTATTGYNDATKGAITNPINSAINTPATPVVVPSDSTNVNVPTDEDKEAVSNLATGAACQPADGDELRAFLTGSTCAVITLVPGTRYEMGAEQTIITGAKVVIGNPINLPILDGSGTPRLFRVAPGARLDLRFVITWRGGGELLTALNLPVLRGGSVYVDIGATFNAVGVIFTNAPPTALVVLVAPNLERAVRVFGGQVFLAGGVMTLTLCHFWVLQPGVLLREIYVVGADVLVAAGVAILSGCTFTNSQLFLNGFGAGFQLAVLGGVLICSGVTFVINFAAINASGAGILTFIGAGVGIFQGCVWNANLGLLTHFGSGIGVFNGAGVVVISGGAFNFNVGAGIEAGTGVFISQGAGTTTLSGVAQALNAGVDFYAGAGVFNWLGAGSWVAVGFAMTRNVGAVSIYGIGGSVGVGAGDLVVIGAPASDDYGVASIVLMGGDWFLGAGILVEIGCPFTKNVGVLFGIFEGINAFVGAGGLVVGNSPSTVNVGIAYLNPNASMYFVQGQKITPATKNFKVMGKNPQQAWDKEKRMLAEITSGAPLVDSFFTVLDGENVVNDGTPAEFVSAIRDSPVSLGDMAVSANFANLAGNVACNSCGLRGDASEIVGAVDGTCTSSASCTINDALVAGANGVATAVPQWAKSVAALFDPNTNSLKMADTAVVPSTLRIGCNSLKAGATVASCASDADVLALVQKSVGSDCARVNLAPHNAAKIEELKEDMPSNQALFFADSALTDVYDLQFISHETECTKKVEAWISGFKQDDIMTKLNEIAPVDVKINNVGITGSATHNVQGNDAANTNNDMTSAAVASSATSVSPSVIVSAPGNTLAFPKFAQGAAAQINLSGFSEGKPITLEITDVCTPLSKEGTLVGTADYNNKAGVAVPITVPVDLKAGSYSIKATQNGIGWCSQPVEVEAK